LLLPGDLRNFLFPPPCVETLVFFSLFFDRVLPNFWSFMVIHCRGWPPRSDFFFEVLPCSALNVPVGLPFRTRDFLQGVKFLFSSSAAFIVDPAARTFLWSEVFLSATCRVTSGPFFSHFSFRSPMSGRIPQRRP